MGKKAKSAQPSAAASSSSSSNGAAPAAATPSTTTAAKPSAERSEFLKLFWSLAESDASARAQAVAQLLVHLEQHAHEPAADGAATEKESDLQYTLKRLVRGLASSRDAARQGFSTALAGLLAAFPAVALRDVQALLRDAMEVHSNMKGMEQREHMFGRLFGLLAMQRSGRLSADQRVAVEVVTELLEMAKWKKWLREACYEAALAVLADVTPDVFVADLAPALALCLAGDASAYNAEQVLLAAGLFHYIHTAGVADKLPAGFPALQFLRRKGMHALAEPLKASSACYPRVHAAWLGIFGHVLHTGKDAAQLDGELFQEAWTVLVENMLLDPASATHERRGLAFKLFELVLPSLPRPLVRAILTPHFVKCLFTNAVSKKNYLHEAARHTLKLFFARAPEEFAHFFQKQFVHPMAALVETGADDEDADADDDTGRTTADAKKARLSGGGFDALIALEEEKERAELAKKKHDNVRMWALDALVTSLAELFAKEDESASTEQLRAQGLRFLVFHTFFVASGKPAAKKKTKKAADVGLDAALVAAEPALSPAVLATSLKRVLSLLSLKLSGEASSVLSRFFATSQELLAAASLRHALAEDAAAQMTTVAARVSELRKAWSAAGDKEAAATKQLEAFLLLFMSSGVQLLDAEQRVDAAVVAADLDKCYADLVAGDSKKRSKAKKTKPQQEAAAADEPNAVVVFTDLLMGLLSQDSSAMRDIVAHVFRSVLPLLNAESIQTMLNVLVPSADDEENDDDDDRVTRREDDEEEDEEGDDDKDDEDDAMAEADEVALLSAADVSKALSVDLKFAELHREDMALAAIVGHVKDRANRKKNAKRAAMQMLHFKLRVLDLLQVFATKCATSPLVLTLVLPLFQALAAVQKTDKDARVLSERLQAVLANKVLRAKEVPSGAELTPAQRKSAAESLAAAVELLTKKNLEKEQAGKVGAGVVVYFVRVLCSGGDAEAKQQAAALVHEAVTAAVADTFTKKHSRFPQSAFDDLIARFPLVAVHVLLQPLAQIASATAKKATAEGESEGKAAADEFSTCEVFRLLSLLLKPKLLAEAAEQQAVRGVLAPLRSALLAVVRGQQAAELKAKRMKLVLACALHVVKAWKQLRAAESKPLAELLAALTALESNSPVVKSMVKQIAEASELPAAIAASAAMTVKKPQATKSTKGAVDANDDDAEEDDGDAQDATKQKKAVEKKTQKAKQALAAAATKKKSAAKTPIAKKRKRATADEDEG